MFAPIDNVSLMWYFNIKNWQNLFKSYSGNLLIIPNQLSEFQAPSLNGFLDNLLTSLKCKNLQRAIALEKFDWIF